MIQHQSAIQNQAAKSQDRRAQFPNFAGVALADILANSVAIVILMIVVTVFVKHEEDQKKLEQVEDVSVLLSREIATSVVMNALPTSAPAVLHHYDTSQLDVNPQPTHMPIIELHGDFVRNYYTGRRIGRDELLLQENSLDKFFAQMTPELLIRTRVDIYSTNLYYIVMSIFKKYAGRLPAHWHFLEYSMPPGKGLNKSFVAFQQEEGEGQEEDDFLQEVDPQDIGQLRTGSGSGEGSQMSKSVPLESSLYFAGRSSSNYPYNDLGFDLPGNFDRSNMQQFPPGMQSGQRGEEEGGGDSAFLRPGGMGGQQGVTRSRFRSANPDAANIDNFQEWLRMMQGDQMGSQSNPFSFQHLLPALFDYMEDVQANADRGGDLAMLERYDLRNDVVERIYNTRLFLPEEQEVFDRIYQGMEVKPMFKRDYLFVEPVESDEIVGTALVLDVNQRIAGSTLLHDSNQLDIEEMSGEVSFAGQFGLYPEIYKGLNFGLLEDMIILLPFRQTQTDMFKWRVITLISPEMDDFVTAFVYAKLNDDGQLVIASDENGLSISNLPIVHEFPKLPLQQEKWQVLFYSLLAALVLMVVIAHYRRTA